MPNIAAVCRGGGKLKLARVEGITARTLESHGKKFVKTLTVHVELGKTSLNFRSRS